jgi:phosphoribosylformylglycinamidine cyclo-ligase
VSAQDAYTRAGVDSGAADRGVRAIVDVLRTIDTGRPSRSRLGGGHYASVLEIAPGLGIALSTDGVGSKLILAEQLGRLDTIGVDCVAMNVNDIVCVGAEPVALLDYIAVERADPAALEQVARGLKRGAELAGVEIPGGELAVLPEMIRGHPSPNGLELSGTAIGTVALDAIVSGERCAPGDVLIGLPSSGLHSNGYTLARSLARGRLDERPPILAGASAGEALLEPTAIYVRAVLALLRSGADVAGLAHITGEGLLNLKRLSDAVGFEIDAPLPVPGVCAWLCALGEIDSAQAYRVFNMGCGFVAVVPAAQATRAAALLAGHHPGAAPIGRVTDDAGTVSLPTLGVTL